MVNFIVSNVGIQMLWYEWFFTPLGLLTISWIVLGFDIAWQFLIAGVYAPKKAENLIIKNPQFKKLEFKVEQFSNDLDSVKLTITGFNESLEGKLNCLYSKIESIDKIETNIRECLNQNTEHLKSSFNGMIGHELRMFYREIDDQIVKYANSVKLPDGALETVTDSGELVTVNNQQLQYDAYFNALSPIIGDVYADKLSYLIISTPPKIKKKLIKKAEKVIEVGSLGAWYED